MVMVKDNKEVKFGQPVLYNNQVGILESVYEDKVNVRITADNQLYTVSPGELTEANKEEMEKYKKSESKDVALTKARELKKELMEYGLWLEVRQASDAQQKQYKEEKEKAAAAANYGPSGNVVTEVKQEPLEVDKQGGEEQYKAGQRAAETEQHERERDQRRQTGVGMAGQTQNQGERTPETAEEKRLAEEREEQRREREKQEKLQSVQSNEPKNS